jgi:hypothetical protein
VLLAKESVNRAEVQALLPHLLIVNDELLYFGTLKVIMSIITLNHIACKLSKLNKTYLMDVKRIATSLS